MEQAYSPVPTQPNNRQANISLISGIIAWVLWLLFICFNYSIGIFLGALTVGITSILCGILSYLPVIPWIVAIITGHLGLAQIGRTGEGGRGMAIAGLIMGYLGLLLTLCTIGAYILGLFGILVLGSIPTPDPSFLTPIP
jgi:hypothetical protein